ncbi:AAA family ATPase [Mycoplasmatota bacterium]|nr:AAA family ATPase [Mycoplasmatota bacterium]
MNEFSRYYVRVYEILWRHIVFFFEDILWNGIIKKIFDNMMDYWDALMEEAVYFSTISWIMVALTLILNLSLIVFIFIRLFLWLRKYISFRKIEIDKEELIEEIADLNDRVIDLVDEKNSIMAMKVSQLGVNAPQVSTSSPSYSHASKNVVEPSQTNVFVTDGRKNSFNGSDKVNIGNTNQTSDHSRFAKLMNVDRKYAEINTKVQMEEVDKISLIDTVEKFVNFSASRLKLFYTKRIISLFFAGLASSKIVILEGISGTGKTSLPYAMAKFFKNNAHIISVQPSWRDRAEMVGYLNEFTKKFNETDFLESLYETIYREDPNFIVLDEFNLARVEYYFAEFLSILEMPDPSEWKIDLVAESKNNDPVHVVEGKITVPQNVWFVGTANRDDSTHTITDKVYDRAIALEFNNKAKPINAPDTEPANMPYEYLNQLFEKAIEDHPMSESLLDKFSQLDNYVREEFKISFGNRIMKQVYRFVPVYVACGGKEVDGLDYIFANKVLRKFENLNLAFIQDEIDDLIAYIKKLFGKGNFEESIRFINDIRKMG